jgi:hypothetical protein
MLGIIINYIEDCMVYFSEHCIVWTPKYWRETKAYDFEQNNKLTNSRREYKAMPNFVWALRAEHWVEGAGA